MAHLLIRHGSGHEEVHELSGLRFRIGRGPENDLSLAERTVSRRHAELVPADDGWLVRDLDSHNHVLVNGEPVHDVPLADEDVIQLGAVALEFVAGQREIAEGPPELTLTRTLRLRDLEAALDEHGVARPGARPTDRRLAHLLALSRASATVQDLPAFLDGLARGLAGALEAQVVLPLVHAPDGRLRAYLAERHDFADDLVVMELDEDLLCRAGGEAVAAVVRRCGRAVNVACAPLQAGLRRLGLLYCERPGTDAGFAVEDLRFLVSVAAQTSAAIETIAARRRMAARNWSLGRQLDERFRLVGESPVMRRLRDFIRRAAPAEAGVLICGESGTGKEVVARAIHRASNRGDAPLEALNCAAVPPALIESELFGHVRGAFTGAVLDRPGRFELADAGTLFLDEVADMPLECQAKLLRVIEEGRVRRLGDSRDRPVDVRELRNVVERMVIMSDAPALDPACLPEPLLAAARGEPAGHSLREMERAHIGRVLRATRGNKKRAAGLLGIDRSTLYAKLRRYGAGP